MAIAIQSSSYAENDNALTTLNTVVTKPTNLAVGDLMLVPWISAGGTKTTPTNWTKLTTLATSGNGDLEIFYKIAEAADAAATDFTFTLTGSNGVNKMSMVAMLRIDGFKASQPLGPYSVNPSAVSGDTTPSISNGITPYAGSYLILATTCGATLTSQDISGIASQAITTSNPSWTEVIDESYNPYTTATFNLSVSGASRPENSATGNTTFTVESSGTIDNLVANAIIVSVHLGQDATVLETTTATDSKLSDIEALESDTTTITDSVTPEQQIWFNENKNSSSWTNTSK